MPAHPGDERPERLGGRQKKCKEPSQMLHMWLQEPGDHADSWSSERALSLWDLEQKEKAAGPKKPSASSTFAGMDRTVVA